MFGFLKEKLKSALSKFTKQVKQESKEEVVPVEQVPEEVKKKEKFVEKKSVAEKIKEVPKKEEKKVIVQEKKKEKQIIEKKEEKRFAKEVPKKKETAKVPSAGKVPSIDELYKKKKEKEKEELGRIKEIEQELEKTEFEELAPEEEKEVVEVIPEEAEIEEEKKIEQEKLSEEKKEVAEEQKPENIEEHEQEKKSFAQKLFGIFKKKPSMAPEEIEKEEKKLEQEESEEAPIEEPEKVEPEFEKKFEKEEEESEELEKEEFEEKEQKAEELEKKREIVKEEKYEKTEEVEEEPKEKKSFFGKFTDTFTKRTLSDEKFDELFWDLELALLENNVAVAVIEKIKNDLRQELTGTKVSRFGVDEVVAQSLKKSIMDLFDVEPIDVVEKIKEKEGPYIIAFVGINGSGKTTNLAKIANYLKKQGFSVVVAAADTFRVAAIEQLEYHCNKVGVKMIKHDYGSDAAAVAFDAIAHAKATDKDVVLIDTAGRSNANVNLMDELTKLIRVSKPDLTLFIGDSLTGNDAVEQAEKFDSAVGIDGIVLTKADVDEKGGAAISISYVTKKPIVFIGTGQTYDDLKPFSPDLILSNLGFA
jgi:fused signal recognition particle receptor